MFQVAVVSLALVASSQGLLEKVCTNEARVGIVVELYDARNNGPLEFGSEDRVEIRDGEYQENLEIVKFEEGGSYASGAVERGGIYTLIVKKPGYSTVVLENIEVPEDECGHVLTSVQQVKLKRDET